MAQGFGLSLADIEGERNRGESFVERRSVCSVAADLRVLLLPSTPVTGCTGTTGISGLSSSTQKDV